MREYRAIPFVPSEVRTDDMPPGVCGRVVGVGLVYEKPDAYGTVWAMGCLERTKGSKVQAGKVGIFVAGQMGHEYGVRSHVGVLRSAETRGNEEHIACDLFDTSDGRDTKEYIQTVLRAGGTTGFSIGCYIRKDERTKDGVVRFLDVELEEFTITPRPAVPGAEIASVRTDPNAMWTMFDALIQALPITEVHARVSARMSGHADDPGQTATDPATRTSDASESHSNASPPAQSRVATEADRARALAAVHLGIPFHAGDHQESEGG